MESSRGEIIDRDNSKVERLLEYAKNKHRGSLKRCQSIMWIVCKKDKRLLKTMYTRLTGL